ncbi:Ig-like domain-containing protein, partial [Christiangramia aquimixticola]|uniref:Ig-like domain-containing protein n=1 Tax=Christiangramia aquimixticola TaxID=1697558 RepID=UPI003AA88868
MIWKTTFRYVNVTLIGLNIQKIKFSRGLLSIVLMGFMCLINFNQAFAQTYIPILDPPGRFEIDGNLTAKDVPDGIDWAPFWNGNEYVLSGNNYIFFEEEKLINGQLKTVTSAVDPNTSVFVIDPIESALDSVFGGGLKYTDDPTQWKSKQAGASPGKGDMSTAFYHISRNSQGDQWLFVGSDRLKNNGTSYIDFEFFQGGVFHDPSTSSFTTTNANGKGRSEGDFLISVKYSNGGSNATVQFFIWENNTYVEYTASIGANDAFASGNTTVIRRPFTNSNASVYDSYLFVEAGLNMTKIFNGIAGQLCDGIELESLLVKTKTSTSDSAQLIDFIGPVPVDIFFGAARITYEPNPVCENFPDTYTPKIEGVKNGTFTAPSPLGLKFVDQDANGKSESGVIDIADSAPGTYEIIYTFDSYGCEDLTSTYEVTIQALPDNPDTNTSYNNGGFSQCDTGQVLNANNAIESSPGTDIVWYDTVDGTTPVLSPTLSVPGTKSYWAEAVSQNGGCISDGRTEVVLQLKEKPVANPDLNSTDEDTPLTISVIANDTDLEDDSLVITAVTDPDNGTAQIIGNEIKYSPDANFHGVDTFVYTITDNDCGTDTALVTVTVNSLNDAPVAQPDAIRVNEGGVATTLVPVNNVVNNTVLANDIDVDGDALTAVLVDNVSHGTLILNENGTFTYTHNGSETPSTDSFTYKVYDGKVFSNTVTVIITIIPVNDAPVANDDTFSGNEDTNIGVTLSGSDVDGTIESFKIKSLPSNGVLKLTTVVLKVGDLIPLSNQAALIFAPALNYNGSPTFTYSAIDNDGLEGNIATITINVLPVNDAPKITNNNSLPTNFKLFPENSTSPVIDWDATDVDGETEENEKLTYALTGEDANLFTLNPNTGILKFLSPPDFEAPVDSNTDNIYNVTVTVSDVAGLTDVQDLAITVTNEVESSNFSINPIEDVEIAENTPYISVTPVISGTPIGNTVVYSISGGADASLFTINPITGVVKMDPKDYENPVDSDANNSYEITIRATDLDNNSDEESWIVYITNTNDNAPVAVTDQIEVNEGGSINVLQSGFNSVLANDTDADGNPLTAILVSGVQHGTLTLNPDGTFIYKHNGEEEFSDSFTYKANDGTFDSNPVVVTINIIPVNDAPVAVADAIQVDEGASTSTLVSTETSVLKNDTDPDSNNLTAILVSGVTNGTLTLNPDGTFIYTHDGSETTSDSFKYKANDGDKDSNTVTVTITIKPVNDAPKAVNDAILVDENETATSLVSGEASVLFNDTDAENNTLTAILVKDVDHGTLILNSDGTFSYEHDGSETLTDSFTYKANDGNLDSNVATVSITITPVNDVPIANEDYIEVNEGATATILESGKLSVLENDTDGDGDNLTVILVDNVQHGTLILNDDGTFSYEHDGTETTSDKFTYKVSDAKAESNIATVWITIIEVNDPPVAANKFFSGDEDTSIDIILTATDVDGTIQFITIESILAKGDLTLNNSVLTAGQQISPEDAKKLVFIPEPDFNGATLFTYSATDDDDQKGNIATVNIAVDEVNDAPVITNNSSLPENATTYIENSTNPVIDWDATDVDGETENGGGLTYALTGEDAALFTLNTDTGVLEFITTPDFEDPSDLDGDNVYKVIVTVRDEAGETDIQSLDITVLNEVESAIFNINPIDDISIAENTPYTSVQPTINGTPIGTVTYSISGGLDASLFTIDPETGIVKMDAKDYENPIDSDANNTYQVTIKATDSDNNSDEETWVVSITNINDNIPVAEADKIIVNEGGTATSLASGKDSVLENDTDADNDVLTAILVDGVNHGTLTLNSDGTFTYTHDGSETISDSFTYKANDGDNDSNTVTVDIEIIEVNDPPVADDKFFSGDEDTDIDISLSADDIDGTIQFFTIKSLSNDGDLSLNNTLVEIGQEIPIADFDKLVFSPAQDYNGITSFTYSATDDDNLEGNIATVEITVVPVNDAPVITNFDSAPFQAINVIENSTSNVIDWEATDVDNETEENGKLTYSLSGGDAGLFELDPNTGILNFLTPPNFESPQDADADNVYNVTVTVKDLAGEKDEQTLAITITDEVEFADFEIDAIADVSIPENTPYTSVTPTITGTPIGTITYSISGGTDAALFTIDPETGVVKMDPKDYEFPEDSDANNTYVVTIKATDSDDNSDEETWVVSITNENDNTPVALEDEIIVEEGGAATVLVSGEVSVLA